ncbi:type IV pilus biogenesis protein PilM [Chloroflexota bacterium]
MSSTAVRLLMTSEKQVERWASTPLEPGLIREGLISDPAALGVKIKQCMENSNIKGSKVIASISGLYSIYRFLNVLQPDGQSSKQAVMQAMTQAMPDSTEEFYLSWQRTDKDESNQQVFAIAMPKYLVDAEVQALVSGGVNPYVLNLKGMALARLTDKQEALIINIELDSIDIVLVANGIPQIMRTIPQKKNIPLEEWVEQLIQNVDHIIYFYNTQHPRSPLNPAVPLFLTGQYADDPDLIYMVRDRIPYPTMPLTIPLEHPRNLPVNQYAVNIGLALKQTPVLQGIEDEQ